MINRKKALDITFPETLAVKKPDWAKTTRTYRVITPLWGDGVEANINDPITLIRGSSIRGHLRFWWRAMRGNSNGRTVAEMREKENSIWGSTKKPSQVKIAVNVTNKGTTFQPINAHGEPIHNVGAMNSMDSYVTFPLRTHPAIFLENVQFEMELEYPDSLTEEVEAALWAWQAFGGVGARTRRGMGAIECIQVDGSPQQPKSGVEFQRSISENLQKWIEDSDYPAGVPHLSKQLHHKLTSRQNDITGLQALRNIVGQYKNFRQSRPDSRRDPRHPGPSHWPEPDLIKACFPSRIFRHPILHRVHGKAPRAVFGLPLIIHFKEYNDGRGEDPEETTIQGVGEIDRLASPLIIRPVHLAQGYAGMAVLLEWDTMNDMDEPYSPPGGLAVVDKNDNVLYNPSTMLTPADAGYIVPLAGNTNPLIKFINSII